MTDHGAPANAHDHTLDLLRRSLATAPLDLIPADTTPPDSVLDGARWVHDWLNMDAELAELTFDSTENVELAGIRATGSLRELTFVSGEHTIEIEIEPGRRTVGVSGTIDPSVAGSMQLVVGGEVFAGEIDESGGFMIDGVERGTALAFVETQRGKIRLGAFEI